MGLTAFTQFSFFAATIPYLSSRCTADKQSTLSIMDLFGGIVILLFFQTN